MLQVRACQYVVSNAMGFLSSGKPLETMWNEEFQVPLIDMAKAHIILCSYEFFKTRIASRPVSRHVKEQLHLLLRLYALHDLMVSGLTSRKITLHYTKRDTLKEVRSLF